MTGPDDALPLLQAEDHRAPSMFEPANLLREARRQKDLPDLAVPAVALLLRDEGTSAHYLPPGRWSRLDETLAAKLDGAFAGRPVRTGSSWTTDAPYRETAAAIAAAERAGVACVEMEAAALYAYATARQRPVVCLAHITDTMATDGDDFEKGVDNGAHDALAVAAAVAAALR